MKRVIALIIVALVLATGTGLASYFYLQQAEERALAQYDSVAVLQATTVIPAGVPFAEAKAQGFVRSVSLPVKYVLPTMLRPDTAVDPTYVANRELASGQLLMGGDFQRTISKVHVLPIPEGYVALSVSVDAAARIAPFLSPGDHVAMMANLGATGPKVQFPDLTVIAIGSGSTIGTGTGGDVPGLLTFAVPAERATDFVAAIQSGGVHLALLPNHATAVTS